jgi:hypothetical protein
MSADVPERARQTFESFPDHAAVFGSYDASPPARGIVSRYRNLLHHYTHQTGSEEVNTFWAGCGAVLRQPFLEVGGFDAERFSRPAIEDIELGYRLRHRGYKIRLDRDMLCTHHKNWILSNMLRTDVFQRAIPWSRLLLEPDNAFQDLNVTNVERLKAIVAVAFWGALILSPLLPVLLAAACGLLVVSVAANAGFFKLVWKRMGVTGLLASVLLHQLYYLYSTVAYAYCVLERLFRGEKRAAA